VSLIDRYIQAVTGRLPKNLRDDVGRELRSSLEEALAGGNHPHGAEPSDSEVSLLLKNYGSPDEIAGSYLPRKKYLIGPELFPTFVKVLKICLIVLACVVGISLVSEIWDGFDSAVDVFVVLSNFINEFIDDGLGILGLLVVIFAINERCGGGKSSKPHEWDPMTLPKLKAAPQIDRTGLAIEQGFAILALVLLWIFPEKIGILFMSNDTSGFITLFKSNLGGHAPLLSVALAALVLRNWVLISKKQWTPPLRLAEVVILLLWIVLYYRMLVGESFVIDDPAFHQNGDLSPDALDFFSDYILVYAWTVIRLIIAGALIHDAIQLIKRLGQLVKKGL
jgi:hypothetical protein